MMNAAPVSDWRKKQLNALAHIQWKVDKWLLKIVNALHIYIYHITNIPSLRGLYARMYDHELFFHN